jgi:hypothetical protein
MRKSLLLLLGVVVALAVPAVALAAMLDTSKFGEYIRDGDACANGASYHIVHPGPYGGDDGIVTFKFSDEDVPETKPSYQSPGKTTHYMIFGTGTLESVSDDIADGKLVISGYLCKT